MTISQLHHYNTERLLKYLAFLQICPEDSSHLQTLKDLQNKVLKGECVTSDESLWSDLEDTQTGLFVENYICYSACQFRAFVSDATDRPWQICTLIDHLVEHEILSIKDLHPVLFFLCLSEKIAERLGLGYYELGNNTETSSIDLLNINEKQLATLSFSPEEMKAAGHNCVELTVLDEYYSEFGSDVELKPILKQDDSYFILSPNALMNCAWRELLKLLKKKMTDKNISQMCNAVIADNIHNNLSQTWVANKTLKEHSDSAFSAIYMLYHHRCFIVSVVAKETEFLDIDTTEPTGDIDVVDVSSHLALMDRKVKELDKDAEIAHIVIPITLQNELVAITSNTTNPVVMILWQPLKTLLKKDDDNALWLFHYASDRKNTHILITPRANEEDVIALYLKHKHSFYLSKESLDHQVAYIHPGYALPLLYDILHRSNKHVIEDAPWNLVVEKEQDCPEDIPYYEAKLGDYELMVGEFMISSIFLRLPKDTKNNYPELHAAGRSLILWYYALERSSGRPVLMKNYKLSIERDDKLNQGFIMVDGLISTLKIGQDFLGSSDGHNVEQKLMEAVLDDADKKGFVLNPEYKVLVNDVYSACKGGLVLRISEHDILSDNSIGEHGHYIVDVRRKSMVIGELADKFNDYPIGLLTMEQSKNLVDETIHYLNKRITTILEQYDLEKYLASMMKLRDGVIFWHKTISERYNAMISFYRFLGTNDPIQEKRIHEFVETDLCTRCLVEYALMNCSKHGNKDIAMDIDSIEEIYALMSVLINMGYLSDYYKSPTFDKVIEVLPNKRFVFPVYEEIGINKFAKLTTLDRLEHPDVYAALSNMVEKIDYKEYETIFKEVFIAEFGVEFDSFIDITNTIIKIMQEEEKDTWMEEIGDFKEKVATEAKVDINEMTSYIAAFSISPDYCDLSLLPMFKEHDKFPCRYKRKLGLINRPICVFQSNGVAKVSFSFRGFVQSQYNLLDNIRNSNYSCMSDMMGKYIGKLNKRRGGIFEAGVFELYQKQSGIICHRSAKIGPKDILQNKGGALGDIDIMLIDNESRKIILIEAKWFNECKTPYEAVDFEKKLKDNLKEAVNRDNWAKSNKALFEWYAKQPTADYQVASVMLTFNLNPTKFFRDDYKTPLPIIWMRDVIENPKSIFKFGEYA